VVLQRAAGNGDLAGAVGPVGAIDQDVRGRPGVGALVALDIGPGDLDVADVAGPRDDAAPGVIAAVTAHDVRLVQVAGDVIPADAVVVVDMAVRQDNVAVPAGQVNAVQ